MTAAVSALITLFADASDTAFLDAVCFLTIAPLQICQAEQVLRINIFPLVPPLYKK